MVLFPFFGAQTKLNQGNFFEITHYLIALFAFFPFRRPKKLDHEKFIELSYVFLLEQAAKRFSL